MDNRERFLELLKANVISQTKSAGLMSLATIT
jgi:hypothetical protein